MAGDFDFAENEPVSLDRIRGRLSIKRGRRSLLKYLRAKERARGVYFLVEDPTEHTVRVSVTLAAIRAYAPELIPPEERTQEADPDTTLTLRQARNWLQLQGERMEQIAGEVVEVRVMPRLRAVEKKVGSRR